MIRRTESEIANCHFVLPENVEPFIPKEVEGKVAEVIYNKKMVISISDKIWGLDPISCINAINEKGWKYGHIV